MVTADALPTVQIDGVVWSQAIVGTGTNATVYAGGSFANARPAGAAAGTNLTPRGNLLAYNLSTGNLVTSFAPNLNAVVKVVAASPDGSRIYVGGNFTTADGGVSRYRIAAYSTATGALISTFKPIVGAQVNAIVATNTTVYVGGVFTTAGGQTRDRLAAFNASDGSLTAWNPNADYNVNAMVLTPDGSRVIVGGAFQNVGGQPEYGLAAVDATTGAVDPWAANQTVQDAGTQAAIESLSTDGTAVYGTGYVYGAGGNLEGTFSADPDSGTINWVEDCHGDTYDNYASGGVVYTVSHAHYCSDVGGYPQTDANWNINEHHTLAFTANATGTLAHNQYGGYKDWFGTPSPSLINWFPDYTTGTYTGQDQAAWSVTGNGQYVVEGGEFPSVNGVKQQGLVRFAVPSIAPNKQGPMVGAASFIPTVVSLAPGTARVSVQSNWDRDDQTLTYTFYRNSVLVDTIVANSQFWNRPTIGFTDTGLTPGATYGYRVYVTDPDGNQVKSNTVTVTIASSGTAPTKYAQDVIADGATHLWGLNESSGSTGYDTAGFDDLTEGTGVGHGDTSPIVSDSDPASTFDGTSNGLAVDPNQITGPNTFTEEAWFKTTSTTGGKIVGFGNAATGTSTDYDRHIYMDANGKIWFGVYNNASYTVSTPKSYNDGAWHYVVATMSSNGLVLYVDGARIGTNNGTNIAQAYSGYWRIGGDQSWSGANYFTGSIADVAIYPTALSLAQVQTHYSDAGGSLGGAVAPTDAYGKAIYADSPALYWRLNDASGSSTAADSSPNDIPGVYSGSPTLGVTSPVSGSGGTAVTFNGNGDSIGSSVSFNNPTVYSEELWFNTTTTNGGKLIGFGDAQTGQSSSYDRHVFMNANGTLTFGTWTGQENEATSASSYNDGKWHFLVATQGADGMNLYVDGQLVATNAQTGAQAFTGYWRVGGDTSWDGVQPWFSGTIDEAAVFLNELTPAQILAEYQASPAAAAPAPTASFTSSVTNHSVAFDASASTATGTASYAWNFGDGSTGTGVTPTHVYASAGNYTVTLTVTDGHGTTATATNTVTATDAPNQPPVAAFTDTTSYLSASFDGSTSSDPDGTVASYAWDFGDGSTGTGVTPTHVYASGGSYTVTLTVTDNLGATNQFQKMVTVVANQPPTAAITSVVSGLSVAFDGSTSHDPDGTVASYAWNFGDGSTSTAISPTHVYASGGTYTVTLTVTDDQGATNTASTSVTVTAPVVNQPPVAGFTSTVNGLNALFTSTSSDPDGTIASYSWNFGDGSAPSVVSNPSYTYASPGTYQVTLTVTDNGGLSRSVTNPVTVTAPGAAVYASDSFARSSANGWGSADTGGAWTVAGLAAGGFTVASGSGSAAVPAGKTATAYLNSTTAGDSVAQVDFTLNVPSTGGGDYVYLAARHAGKNEYRLRAKLLSTGVVQLSITKVVNSTETVVLTNTIGGVSFTPGTPLRMKFQVQGSSSVTLTGKVWAAAATEPTAWQISTTDASSPLAAGAPGIEVYTSSTITNGPVTASFGNYSVKSPTTTGNAAPTAAFTSSTSGLSASFNAAGSTDSDGTIASYSWNFGDGTPAVTGVAPTHAFASANTYQVTLTVTDNQGGVGTVTNPVNVAAPVNQAPNAAFTYAVTGTSVAFDGTGSRDPDGSIASYAWNFGDGTTSTSSTPTHAYAAAGTYAVTLVVTDNQGATGTVTQSVTTTNSTVTVFAADSFNRTVASGWGSADAGGAWTTSASPFSVTPSTGNVSVPAGATATAYLNGTSIGDSSSLLDFSLDRPTTGNGNYVYLAARHSGKNEYRLRVKLLSTGVIQLSLTKVVAGTETVLTTSTISGLTVTSGQALRMKFQVQGTTSVSLAGKVWLATGAEPTAFQVTNTDTTNPLGAGSPGVVAYTASNATNAPVTESFSNLSVTSITQ